MPAAAHKLVDSQGRPVELGPPLASGGEGTVHVVVADAAVVAKVYHKPPAHEQIEKLRHMTAQATPELCRFAAWPTATLHDRPGGLVVGFLMPRFAGFHPIHTLYSPAHRRTAFPAADWAFLVHTARNAAVAFDALHARGIVVGDVNQSNVLVSDKALVALIDCDSFQVPADGRPFLCPVGVSPYTPPELQGQNFRHVVRTVNHDRFGLAVLIFHLLFMGRHPFAGRFLGSGEMPLEQAIAEHRFVYSRHAAELQMAPPPSTLSLPALSPELRQLFESAFGRGSEAEKARPTADEWQAALADFARQLRTCPEDAGHKVPAHLLECPWCAIVKAGGPNFFLGAAGGGTTFDIDPAFLTRLGQRVERAPYRPFTFAPPPRPDRLPVPTPAARRAILLRGLRGCVGLLATAAWLVQLVLLCLSWKWWLLCLGGAVCLSLLYRLFRVNPALSEEARRRQALYAAVAELDAAIIEWEQLADRYRTQHRRLRDALKQLRDQYRQLPARYEAERPQNDKEAYFRNQYLRTCFISDHDIDRIGPNRQVLLASYGVETAYDVEEERLLAIRGIGPVLAGNLLTWRRKMAAQFRYDPQAVVPEAEVRAVVLKYQKLEEGLRGRMQRTVAELEALHGQTEEQLRPVGERIEALLMQAAQAEADLQALGR
jgi:DNA-binding helix-hairpin-helix protein with protein kinase domain